MKLYTEIQLRNTWSTAFMEAMQIDNDDYKAKIYDDFIKKLTPIELPSDEEIYERAFQQWGDYSKTSHQNTYLEGAKWMRDKIQGGNNEQQ